MKLIVFGATGMLGKELVKQALYNGHEVTAFGRNVFTEGFPEDKHLHLVQGALFDEKDVLQALKNKDAVISALGGSMNGQDKTRSLGMKNIVQQMQHTGLQRIVAVGGLGVLEGENGKLLMEAEDFPQELIPVSQEHRKAWQYLENSQLDFTFVCPPTIISGEPTGIFQVSETVPPPENRFRIASGDLALFMLNCLRDHLYSRCRVGISN